MKLFDKCTHLAIKLRHFLILSTLLAALLFAAGWIYMDNIRAATDNTNYAWVVDSADTTTAAIAADGSFRQSFTTADPVFGGGFVLTTYDRICYGTVTLSLEDENGQVLASTSMLGIELYDNTFQQFVFDEAIYPDGQTTYTFVITFTKDEDHNRELGVWVSETAHEGIANYTLNGEEATTCASFAIVTNYAGNFIIPVFFACAAFAALALVVGYWLLFIRKVRPHTAFAFFALTLGLLYMLLIPPYVAPDEETHVHTAYAFSNTILGIENEGWVSVRASDDISFDTADVMDIFSYQTVAQNLFGTCEDETMVGTDYTIVYTEPFYLYLPTTIGLTIARLCNFNYITLIFFGRVMNLLAYTALVSLAIYHMPRFKRILCMVGLLPMSLMLAASFNYDAIVLATAFLYTAIVLKTALCEEDFSYKQLIVVAVLGLLLAPMKKLYVLLCLFCCIIPLKKCPKLVRKYFWPAVGLCAVVGICLIPKILDMLWISKEYLEIAATIVLPDANPLNMDYNENYYWTAPYMLTHLPAAAKMLARTIQENTGLYLTQLIGGKAGEYILLDLPIWAPLIGVFYGILSLSVVPTDDEEPMLRLGQKCWSLLLLLATLGGLAIVFLSWTPIRNTTIWGIQGRYLLPLLPMTLLIFQSKVLTIRQNIERQLIFVAAYANILAIASVFQQIMGFAFNT